MAKGGILFVAEIGILYLTIYKRSAATVEKYIRDVKSFSAFVNGAEVTKEVVIEYKKAFTGKPLHLIFSL